MPSRISLKEFQQSVAARLADAAREAPRSSKLGFLVGGESWLVDLGDAAEIIPVPALQHVPLMRPWFRGLANLRGSLVTVADLGHFLGTRGVAGNPENRLLVAHPRFGVNAGLLVERVVGLRNPDKLSPLDGAAPPWSRGRYRDADGGEWVELDFARLLRSHEFLHVAA